jgi:hypothetical protein
MSEESKKWYRVIDPLSPLHGCDVSGREWLVESGSHLLVIDGVRRVDIFVGDRPFQRIAGAERHLGLYIEFSQLEDSLIQDEVVELSREKPYGIFLNESSMTRNTDGHTLRIVQYERATQVALDDGENEMLGHSTILGHRSVLDMHEAVIIDDFEHNMDPQDLVREIADAADCSQKGAN